MIPDDPDEFDAWLLTGFEPPSNFEITRPADWCGGPLLWRAGFFSWDRERIVIDGFKVVRSTPKGFVIDDHHYGRRRFILADPLGKRYAYASQADAVKSLVYRRRRALRLYESAVKQTRGDLDTLRRLVESIIPPKVTTSC